MSEKDARRITVISQLLESNITIKQAAKLLGLSHRQIMRLKAEAIANGTMSILHKSRGKRPPNSIPLNISNEIIQLLKNDLKGYNFVHATDVLSEEQNIHISVSTVSRLAKKNGIVSPKAKRRPKNHRSRPPRSYEGEMAASPFDWLSNGTILHLHGAIDDATGKILCLYLDTEETFKGYSECVFQMNKHNRVPRELYTDKRTIFFYDSRVKKKLSLEEELAGLEEKEPNFSRALKDLGVILILANSAQAKGKIERLWNTLQDRLTKDLKRKGNYHR